MNGVDVQNLKHLCSIVKGGAEVNLRFDLGDERVIVLNFQNAKLTTSRILKQHKIPSVLSKDLDEQADQIRACCLWSDPFFRGQDSMVCRFFTLVMLFLHDLLSIPLPNKLGI